MRSPYELYTLLYNKGNLLVDTDKWKSGVIGLCCARNIKLPHDSAI